MPPTPWTPNTYPPARRSDHVDVYKSKAQGDVRVHDPYEWLEHQTEETQKWIEDQAAYTQKYLDQNPDKERLKEVIRKNTDFAKFSAPSLKKDGRWYWSYNSGLQAQSVIYRSKGKELPDFSNGSESTVGEVFFDPNLLSDDGTAALAVTSFSWSGEYFAYGISLSGSDFFTIYVRPTSSPFALVDGKRPDRDQGRLPDEIRFAKFSSITWTHDSKGFFYQRYADREQHGLATEDKAGTETEEDLNAMLYYHRIGTPQSEDILVMKDDANPRDLWSVDVGETDSKYLVLYTSRDTSRKNLLWIADMTHQEIGPNIKWDKLIDVFEAEYSVIANDDAKFYIQTNKDAPKYKVVTIDIADKDRKFEDLIPEDPEALLVQASAVNWNSLAVLYSRDVKDELYIYSLDGKRQKRLAEDFVGAIGVACKRYHSWFFPTLVGFTTPGTVAKYDFEKPEDSAWSIYRKTLVPGINADEYIAQQVWYENKDGTKVPMFIVRHVATKLDGTAPAIVYGYGGFSYSVVPFFSVSLLSFIKAYRGIFAVPNIRGGAEFGEEWHLAGTRERKVNVFDDFIAATQYLVDKKYAGPGLVAINGASNGGLLVAACVNRAPKGLIGAAVAEVGVLDLLKFSQFTIGKAWTSDYGDPADPADFDFIYPISPLHNIPQHELPPTILLTADHDDRVVPLHSFKHAATLQHTLPNNPHPLLLRVDKKAGHGAGKATDKKIQEAADKWGFVAQSLGLRWQEDGADS